MNKTHWKIYGKIEIVGPDGEPTYSECALQYDGSHFMFTMLRPQPSETVRKTAQEAVEEAIEVSAAIDEAKKALSKESAQLIRKELGLDER